MAIKKNTQKLLLALYTPQPSWAPVLSQKQLRGVTAEMTDSGFRSLLLFMEGKDLIYKQQLFSQSRYGLTDHGRRELNSLFPSLNPSWSTWNGTWMALTFLEAPQRDLHFRYLRASLIKERALPLSRGIFIIPDSFSDELLRNCRELYRGAVAIFSVADWILGVDTPLVTDYYDLSPLAENYSSISKEADRLLVTIDSKKRSSNQSNLSISNVFDRFLASLKQDVGILNTYFPGVPGAIQLQQQLQRILQL